MVDHALRGVSQAFPGRHKTDGAAPHGMPAVTLSNILLGDSSSQPESVWSLEPLSEDHVSRGIWC